MIVNLLPASWTALEPESVVVILEPRKSRDDHNSGSQAKAIVITSDELQKLRWIRIVAEAEKDEGKAKIK